MAVKRRAGAKRRLLADIDREVLERMHPPSKITGTIFYGTQDLRAARRLVKKGLAIELRDKVFNRTFDGHAVVNPPLAQPETPEDR